MELQEAANLAEALGTTGAFLTAAAVYARGLRDAQRSQATKVSGWFTELPVSDTLDVSDDGPEEAVLPSERTSRTIPMSPSIL